MLLTNMMWIVLLICADGLFCWGFMRIRRARSMKRSMDIISESNTPILQKHMFTFSFERHLLSAFNFSPEQIRIVLYTFRCIIVVIIVILFYFFHGLALAAIIEIGLVIFFDDLYKREVYKTGINNIPVVNNFIDVFAAQINSGVSTEKAFNMYIKYNADIGLQNYLDHKNDINYKATPEIKQIIDIYDVAKHNDIIGSDQTKMILTQIAQDYTQKMQYFTDFHTYIGSVNSIVWCHYLAVPFFVWMSYRIAFQFWNGFGGYVVCLVLVLFFAAFKFLMFRLQRSTLRKVF